MDRWTSSCWTETAERTTCCQETAQALLWLAQNLKNSLNLTPFPPVCCLLIVRLTKLFRTGASHYVSSNLVHWVPSDSGYAQWRHPLPQHLFRGAWGSVSGSWSWQPLHLRTPEDCRKHEQDICVYSGGHRPRSKVCNTVGVKSPCKVCRKDLILKTMGCIYTNGAGKRYPIVKREKQAFVWISASH